MESDCWEVGSEFHDPECELEHDNERVTWPGELVYFLASGRLPVLLLKDIIGDRVLHYPDFFCWDVIEYWQRQGIRTRPYRVYFSNGKINVDYSSVPKRGVVLAVNYFGTDDGKEWMDYKSQHDILLIEDHSHSPVSQWACTSIADYAFSSLRKTLPISEGGAFWSPNGSIMPAAPTVHFEPTHKKKAMALKQRYLKGEPIAKNNFLALFAEGEQILAEGEPLLASSHSYNRVKKGFPIAYIDSRRKNLDVLCDNLNERCHEYIELLDFSSVHSPFGAVFKCLDSSLRTELRAYLIANNVYCAIHWPQKEGCVTRESKVLSECLITVPIDQRYTKTDMCIVAQLINRFFENERI
ncbi:hypothetical protein J8M20_11830 [Pseudoalteromonas luteoviolacea]|uniref:hypothetical protein n=1 Tax=Pseudoalteromonas luteoviolacea TaxID=43657 RepID=UPI001B379828|nr:hypothetical protein [Pseudoalteromonas luteoviolacea]MBQ4812035.1 hypothetical protein [Pseudoalteromonas luteoviolacea]